MEDTTMRHVTHAVTIIMALAVIALGINDYLGDD